MNDTRVGRSTGLSIAGFGVALTAYSMHGFVQASFPIPPPLLPATMAIVGIALIAFGYFKYRQFRQEQLKQRKAVQQDLETARNFHLGSALLSPGTQRTAEATSPQSTVFTQLQRKEAEGKAAKDSAALVQTVHLAESSVHSIIFSICPLPSKKIRSEGTVASLVQYVTTLHTLGGNKAFDRDKFKEQLISLFRLDKSQQEQAVPQVISIIEAGIKNIDQVLVEVLCCQDDQIPNMIQHLKEIMENYDVWPSQEKDTVVYNWSTNLRNDRRSRFQTIIKTLEKYVEVSTSLRKEMESLDGGSFESPKTRREHEFNHKKMDELRTNCRQIISRFTGPHAHAMELTKRLNDLLESFERTQLAKLQHAERRLRIIEQERGVREVNKIAAQGFGGDFLQICWKVADIHRRINEIEWWLKEQNVDPSMGNLAQAKSFLKDGLARLQLDDTDQANIKLLCSQGKLNNMITSLFVGKLDATIEKLLAKLLVLAIITPTKENIAQLLTIVKAIKEKNNGQWLEIEKNHWLKDLLLRFYTIALMNEPEIKVWHQCVDEASFKDAMSYIEGLSKRYSPDAIQDWLLSQFKHHIRSFDLLTTRLVQKKSINILLLFVKLINTSKFPPNRVATNLLKLSRRIIKSAAANRKGLFEKVTVRELPTFTIEGRREVLKVLTELSQTEEEVVKRLGFFAHVADALTTEEPMIMQALEELPAMHSIHDPALYTARDLEADPFKRNCQQLAEIVDFVHDVKHKAEGALSSYERHLKAYSGDYLSPVAAGNTNERLDKSLLPTLQDLFSSDPMLNYIAALAQASVHFDKHIKFLTAIGFDNLLAKHDEIFPGLPVVEKGAQNLLIKMIQRVANWKAMFEPFFNKIGIPDVPQRQVLACITYSGELSDLYARIEQAYGKS